MKNIIKFIVELSLLILMQLSCFAQATPSYIDTNKLVTWLPFTNTSLLNYVNTNNDPFRSNDIWFVADRNNTTNNAVYTHKYAQGPLAEESYIDLYHYSGLKNTTHFTISVWAKLADNVAGAYIISSYKYDNNTFFGIGSTSDSSYFQFVNQRITNYDKLDNNWHNFVAIVDNDSMFLYIDDILKAKGKVTTYGTYIEKFIIGYNTNQNVTEPKNSNSTTNYNGAVDDVAIWNRAISRTEITQLYKAIDTGTSIANIYNDPNISIAPNPAQNNICVKHNTLITNVEIYNISGTLVYRNNPNTKLTNIDISNLITGTYIIKVNNSINKIVKQ